MKKAFKEYGACSDFEGCCDVHDEEEINDAEADDYLLEPVEMDTDRSILLPFHICCVSHTISLICTTDASKVADDDYKKMSGSVFSKCGKLWKMSGRPKAAKIILDKIGKQLRLPCVTRWNSLYNSILVLLECKANLNKLMTELKLTPFTNNELQFLEEYTRVMKPLADALDRLQAENDTYFGVVLPSLLAVESKLRKLELGDLTYCKSLVQEVLKGLNKRFHSFLTLSMDPVCKLAIVSSISNPRFKLKWLRIKNEFNNVETKTKVLQLFDEALKREVVRKDKEPENFVAEQEAYDQFFDYEPSKFDDAKPSLENDIQKLSYLDEDTSVYLESLHRFPVVKRIFMRYNTPIPSSAPVERLFSFAGHVHSPRRNRLGDDTFRTLVLMKANSSLLAK